MRVAETTPRNARRAKTAAPLPAGALDLRQEMLAGAMQSLKTLDVADGTVEVCLGRDSLWLLVRGRRGGYALRTAYCASGLTLAKFDDATEALSFSVDTAIGRQDVTIVLLDRAAPLLRATTVLTPTEPLLLHNWPRDLYPIDRSDDPLGATGRIEAAQRGLNAPVVFVRRTGREQGCLLYFQDLTSLNPYFRATGTRPDGVVGGRWPELGYQPPVAPQVASADDHPVPGGQTITIADTYLVATQEGPSDPQAIAQVFLDLMAAIYPHLVHPATHYHDWPEIARRSAHDLRRSSKATVTHYRHRYLRPYLGAEVPDSMVQLCVTRPIGDLTAQDRRYRALADSLRTGVPRFFDAKLGTVRRFLPNVVAQSRNLGNEKDADEVDSWYLYHPLKNLAAMALAGDTEARRIALASADFAIKVAQHFKYRWPVLFDINTFEVKVAVRKEGDPGQSDVGGLYALVMLDLWKLSGDARFLREARKAIEATRDLGFALTYQTNLTASGALACLRLWQATQDRFFLDQSFGFLANFFHNTVFWSSGLGAAEHYCTFMGATCLHDGPYMAIFECFESWEAFNAYLAEAGAALPHSVRLLLSEYCRYALERGWFFYPGHLPPNLTSDEIRNGEIDRDLAIPVEDLYADGAPPGQVGQEIYGTGAAFAFAARAWRRVEGVPLTVFTEYPLIECAPADKSLTLRTAGVSGMDGRLRVLAKARAKRVTPELLVRDGARLALARVATGEWEARVPADAPLTLSWR